MAFMTALVSVNKEFFMFSDELEEIVFCKYNGVRLPEGHYDEDDEPNPDADIEADIRATMEEFKVTNFDIKFAYYGQLSADGYMDQTDYYLGDTQAEVAQQLLDMYYSGEVEYMDAEEVDDMNWLQSIVDAEPQE